MIEEHLKSFRKLFEIITFSANATKWASIYFGRAKMKSLLELLINNRNFFSNDI